jgi:hypothetical protein
LLRQILLVIVGAIDGYTGRDVIGIALKLIAHAGRSSRKPPFATGGFGSEATVGGRSFN